jgi:predicted DNA-binding mobile mystery protein A
MSQAQLGARLRISQPAVIKLEQSESKGTMELATLRRVAEALNCTVAYALIPNQPLEDTIRGRARLLARRWMAPVEHTMLLEDQQVTSDDTEARLDEFIRDTNPRLFWE